MKTQKWPPPPIPKLFSQNPKTDDSPAGSENDFAKMKMKAPNENTKVALSTSRGSFPLLDNYYPIHGQRPNH